MDKKEQMRQEVQGYKDTIDKAKKQLPERNYIPTDKRYVIKATAFEIPVGYIHIDDVDLFVELLEKAGVIKNEERKGKQ